MPILSLGEICSTATMFAAGRGDWSLSEASRLANFAYSDLYNKIGHTPLQAVATSSTTSGENRYQLPTDYGYGMALTLFQGSNVTTSNNTVVIRLRQVDAGWMDAQTLSPSGVPEAYEQYATWYQLWPSPNSAYSLQLRYQVKPPTLVYSTDTPVLDERWHAGIVYKTVELLNASRNDVEGEAIARNRYLNFMATIPTDKALRQRDRSGMAMRYQRKFD